MMFRNMHENSFFCDCSFYIATQYESPPSMVISQAALGGVLGVSVVINIISITVIVVLLVKMRGGQSSPSSSSRETEEDIDMKPNALYGFTDEGIVTKPNEVYGVTTATTETDQPGTYEYVNP